MEEVGALQGCRYLLHDRDTKYTRSFRAIIDSSQVKTLAIPARSPNLNAYAERWVRSVKEECLSKLILFGECSLRRVLTEYVAHFHAKRNHQGKGNVLLFPSVAVYGIVWGLSDVARGSAAFCGTTTEKRRGWCEDGAINILTIRVLPTYSRLDK